MLRRAFYAGYAVMDKQYWKLRQDSERRLASFRLQSLLEPVQR